MKLKRALIISSILAALIAYSWLAFGLSDDSRSLVGPFALVALTADMAGLLAAIFKRQKIAWACWAMAAAMPFVLQRWVDLRRAEWAREAPQRIESAKASLLAAADARVPCDNGDTALLIKRNNPITNRMEASILIISPIKGKAIETLAREDGYASTPASDRAIRLYIDQQHSECRNAGYPSLAAMMVPLRAHFEVEHPKYEKSRK